jgi:hypothetical protein
MHGELDKDPRRGQGAEGLGTIAQTVLVVVNEHRCVYSIASTRGNPPLSYSYP